MGLEDRLDGLVDECVKKVISGEARADDHRLLNILENYVRGNVPVRVVASDVQPLLSESKLLWQRTGGNAFCGALVCVNTALAAFQLYGGLPVGAVLSGFVAAYFYAAYDAGCRSERVAVPVLVYAQDDVERVLEARKRVIGEKLRASVPVL